MLTIENLRAWGANTEEALRRCMNHEAFYLGLVSRAMQDDSIGKLKEAVEAGDLARGFELAHALKGTMGNLALTPICTPVQEITELLRARAQADYAPLLSEIIARRDELIELLR